VITYALKRDAEPMPRSAPRKTALKPAPDSPLEAVAKSAKAAKAAKAKAAKLANAAKAAPKVARAAAPKVARPASPKSPRRAAPKSAAAALEQVYLKDRGAWRRWLEKHHAHSPGIWLVYDRKSNRADRLAYVDAVEEALCFGWIDSLTKSFDESRYMQMFTPRKPKGTWARTNKARVERLIAEGRMAPAGLAAIELAKANGAWTSLDAVEALSVPDDLAAALSASPDAARNFAAFPPSARKAYLHWVSQAVRPETRAQRIADVVMHSAANRKARQLASAPRSK
jgi:uncharacterized protein YdeI (YjbR/CyaY-like superfamily)